jgi:hypothetical protein
MTRIIAPITTLVIGFSALVLGIYIGAENFNRDRCIPVKSQPQSKTVKEPVVKYWTTDIFAETEEEFQVLLGDYKAIGYIATATVKDPVTNRKYVYLRKSDTEYLHLHGYIFPPKHSN